MLKLAHLICGKTGILKCTVYHLQRPAKLSLILVRALGAVQAEEEHDFAQLVRVELTLPAYELLTVRLQELSE